MFKDTDKFNGQMCVFVNFERIFCTTMFMLKSTGMTYHVSALIKEHICHLLSNQLLAGQFSSKEDKAFD